MQNITNIVVAIVPSLPDEFASTIYNHHLGTHDTSASGENKMPQVSQSTEEK